MRVGMREQEKKKSGLSFEENRIFDFEFASVEKLTLAAKDTYKRNLIKNLKRKYGCKC